MQYVGALIVIVEMIGADTGTARTVTRAVAVDQDVAADIITSGQPQPCSEPPRTLPQNVQMFDDTTLNAAAFVMARFRDGF